MSRLDDELRMAFRREQPSPDFTDQVLKQIARQPAPRVRWWRTLAALFQPPKLRWVAIGATAALLVAIGAAQYARLHPAVIEDSGKVADAGEPKPEAGGNTAVGAGGVKAPEIVPEAPAPKLEPKPHRNFNHRVVAVSNRTRNNAPPGVRVVNPEAEAAKEKVMLALYITNTMLSDAQRAISDADKPQR